METGIMRPVHSLCRIVRYLEVVAMMVGLLLLQGCRNDPPAPPDDDPVVIPNETRSLDLDNDDRVDFLFSYLGMQTMDEPPSVIS